VVISSTRYATSTNSYSESTFRKCCGFGFHTTTTTTRYSKEGYTFSATATTTTDKQSFNSQCCRSWN
jgi:hypothetical protein